MADFCTFLHSLFRLFSSSVIREGSHQPMSEAGRKLGACGVLRVAACVRWPRRGPAVGVQCKSGQAALAINIATTSLQCINESTKRAEPPALAAVAYDWSKNSRKIEKSKLALGRRLQRLVQCLNLVSVPLIPRLSSMCESTRFSGCNFYLHLLTHHLKSLMGTTRSCSSLCDSPSYVIPSDCADISFVLTAESLIASTLQIFTRQNIMRILIKHRHISV